MRAEDFLHTEHVDGVTTFWIDHRLESENIVSPAVIELLEEVFAAFEADPEARAGIIISKKKNFIAGADIKSFAIEKKGDFRPVQAKGHHALLRLESSKKPIVAAIHGACMGLGTELALACHARVAANDPTTRLALPEVQLGLLPGGGGTQRLPRLIGIQPALDMMLTGKNIFAHRALKMGLVDELVHKNKLLHAARIMARRLIETPASRTSTGGVMTWLLEKNGLGRKVLFHQARKRAFKRTQGNYPAIPAILDCVETGYSKGIEAGYEKELEWFETLMLTEESKALRQLFFAVTDNKKLAGEGRPVRRIGVVGAGFMGAGIAEVSALNGFDVLLKDINDEVVASARQQVWNSVQKKLRYKAINRMDAEQIMGRVQGQLTYDNFGSVDLVVEAVLERMALKRQIIDDLEAHGREDLVIASNTSSLSIAAMAAEARRPEQIVGMHYFSPVPKMPLLEIVRGPQTASWVIDTCLDVGIRQGKTCIIVKDSPGFYVNRILAPYMNEALLMLDEGIGMVAIDKAMRRLGFPVGPIELFDQVGLDIAAHVVESSAQIVAGRAGFVDMFETGRLGKKNKSGFYRYHHKTGKKTGPDETAYQFFAGNGGKNVPGKEIQQRLLLLMLNEAVLCLQESVIEGPRDGDLGAVFGIGFMPFTGGPFRYIDREGAGEIVRQMDDLSARFGPKYTAATLLQTHAANNRPFYD